MKKIAFALVALFSLFVFNSCNEETICIPATFKGFKITPNEVHPGDTIVISAVIANPGKYCSGPKCDWNLQMDTLDANGNVGRHVTTKSIKTTIAQEALSAKFVIPQSACPGRTASCKLSIQMFNDMGGCTNVGMTYPNNVEEGYLGKFSDSQVLTLYCTASGNLTFTVKE